MDAFSTALLALVSPPTYRTVAWCVLPNHYHLLVEAPDILRLLQSLGQFHGRTSYQWNGEEQTRGRKVFFRAVERAIKSERHFWATMNYVHHNPVHHRYVQRWADWRWSSAADFLAQMGHEEAERIWRSYPVREYGKGWDDPDL